MHVVVLLDRLEKFADIGAMRLGQLRIILRHVAQLARGDVGEFLQAIEEHDDVDRVWAAVR